MQSLCPWESARYFWMYSSNVPPLLYYSHIPALIIAVFWGVFIFLHAPKDIRTYSLLALFGFFALWTSFDLVLWATNRPDVTIFFWSLQVLLEVLVFLFSFYLVYTYQNKKNPPIWGNILMTIGVVPFILLTSTKHNLLGVNLSDCFAVENIVAKYYSYALEVIFLIAISVVSIKNYRKTTDKNRRKEIILISLGVFIFLLLFIYGNLIGSFFDNWVIAQFGLFGMPIFVTFLVYATVRFKTFNVKLIGAQALVLALVALIGSEFFFVETLTNMILVGVSLLGTCVIGIFLVRGVKHEVEQRERLEKLSAELTVANSKLEALSRQKSEFVSIASHQLRTPLTAIKGYSSMLLEGSFGKLDEKVHEAVDRVFQSSERLVAIIEDFLNISRIELGRMHYEFTSIDLKKMMREVAEEQIQNAKDKGLTLMIEIPEGTPFMIWADAGKVRQVISNIVDNAVKYTPQGSVTVSLESYKGKYRFRCADTGIGLSKQEITRLFEKYNRTEEAKRQVAAGSGLGLFIAQQIMKAHGGVISASSLGPKKGTIFTLDFSPDTGDHATIIEETRVSILSSDANNQPTNTAQIEKKT